MKLFIDDSYFPLSKGISIDNASLIGCILIAEEDLILLLNILRTMKSFDLLHQPIKFCMDDRVKKEYFLRNKEESKYILLKQNHSKILHQFLKKVASINYQVIAAWDYVPIVGCKKIDKQKSQNTSQSFYQVVKSAKSQQSSISIMSDNFKDKQQALLNKKMTILIKEHLEDNPSSPPPEYSTGFTLHSRPLQFADIIVGVLRKIIQSSIKEEPILSPHCAYVIPKLAGFPNNISEKGLFGPPKYQDIILETMKTTLDYTSHLSPFEQ